MLLILATTQLQMLEFSLKGTGLRVAFAVQMAIRTSVFSVPVPDQFQTSSQPQLCFAVMPLFSSHSPLVFIQAQFCLMRKDF